MVTGRYGVPLLGLAKSIYYIDLAAKSIYYIDLAMPKSGASKE